MEATIIEYKRTLTDILCEDIIEKFEENYVDCFIIPKNCAEWQKLETVLYKELLIKINLYKNHIINNNLCDETNEILLLLNRSLFIKNFVIHKYSGDSGDNVDGAEAGKFFKLRRTNNRYNVLTFVYFLNDCENGSGGGGGELVFGNQMRITPEAGKLLIFPENREHHHNELYVPVACSQYIISGQLCYENIIL